MSRTILIGDVHGCLDEFRSLLKLLSFVKGSDRLIQVGDLMDRGPDPVGCVRLARELEAIVLMGNHEEKHIRFRKHQAHSVATGKKNPMKRFSADKAAQNAALSDDDVEWLKSLPLTFQVKPNLIAVHAGLEPAFPATEQSSAVIRVRYVDDGTRDKLGQMVGYADGSLDQPASTTYWAASWKGPESVVYGHAVHSLTEPRIDRFEGGACYGIDTGCCFGGRLTAMVLTDGEPEFVQVQARETYFQLYRENNGAD